MPGALAKYGALTEAVKNTTAAVAALGSAATALGATVASVFPAAKADIASTGQAITQVAQGIRDVQKDFQDSQLAMLEKLKQLVLPFEGTDAGSQFSFDRIIEDQIAKVKAGEETGTQAIQELQRQFGSVYGTLQQAFFGSQDPSTQAFLLAIETFINSGNLPNY